MKKYLIHDLRPWKDIYYFNCFYPPLLTAVTYLGGSVYPFLVNDFFCYSFHDSDPIFKICCNLKKIDNDETVLRHMGVNVTPVNSFSVENIKALITGNTPVVCQIDRYIWKEKSNEDFYKKRHMAHTFVLFGYEDNTFIGIDADSQAGVQIKSLDADNLILAHDMFHNNGRFQEGRLPSAFYLRQSYHQELGGPPMIKFAQNFGEAEEDIRNGLERIKDAIVYYLSAVSMPNDFLAKKELFFSSMTFKTLETAKEMEKYRLMKFKILDDELNGYINSAYTSLNIIKGTIMKAIIKDQYDSEIAAKLERHLIQLYDAENNYLSLLSSVLKK